MKAYAARKVAIYMRGKNLLNIPDSFTWTGVRFIQVKLLAGDYTLSRDSYIGGGNDIPCIVFFGADNVNAGTWFLSDKKKTISLSGGTYTIYIYANGFNYSGSQGVTSTINKLMLEEGTVATEYEPYNSPNLLPYPYKTPNGTTYRGITMNANPNGIVSLSGTCTLTSQAVFDFQLTPTMTLPAGTYRISGCPNGGSTYKYRLFVIITKANESTRYASDYGDDYPSYTESIRRTFELEEGDTFYVVIRCGNEIGTVKNLTFKPMLVKGNTATKYEPYGRKRHKMKVIRRGGKNLWDYKTAMVAAGGVLQEDGSVKVLSSQVYNGRVAWYPEDGTKVITMTVTMKNEQPDGMCTTYPTVDYTDGTRDTYGKATTDAYQKYKTTVFTTRTNKIIRRIIWGYNYGNYTYIKDVQIEYGDAATEYEPFKIV